MRFSVLDLCRVPAGSTVAQALRDAVALAVYLETLAYPRIWYAEHHNMPAIASAATSVLIGQVAAATKKIIVGAGGVMLPNHSPLVIAEQFGTLEAFYPGRIELGLGRAPGSDAMTMRALRRNLETDPDSFPRDVVELLNYFQASPDRGSERGSVRAIPGSGQNVPVWILGSSLFGARLAAYLGLPYAFASHFAPAQLFPALAAYRHNFRPSSFLPKPHVMVALNVIVAKTDEEAHYLFSSQQQAFVNLHNGNVEEFPAPVADYVKSLSPEQERTLAQALSCSAIGSPETVFRQIQSLKDSTAADEFIVTCPIYDQLKRFESFRLLSEIVPHFTAVDH